MGDIAIVVDSARSHAEALERTLASIAAHTAAEVAVTVAGDGGAGPADAAAALREITRSAPHADVVLVQAGVRVAAGWLEGLREAVGSDSIVMTASALTALAQEAVAFEEHAALVRAGAARLRPSLPAALPGCCYLRAAGLQLVGVPEIGGDDKAVLFELSRLLSATGLVHVLADDVLIAGGQAPEIEGADADAGSLRRAEAAARTAARPLSVTIDARALGSAATGMRTYILDLIAALARDDAIALRVTLPPDTSSELLEILEGDPAIELVSYDESATTDVALTDVVHRPQQIFTADDLRLLRRLGRRIVITHHDLIAYRCASYHASPQQWRDFRRVTRLTLAEADMVVFPSQHARADALREDLVAPPRAHAVANGAERRWPRAAAEPLRPAAVPVDTRLLVCIGTDYAHKNRPFAIALARALRERHGWDGRLVLAGPHVAHGSSREHEQALLAADPSLGSIVVELGTIDDAARAWLFANADAIVYPSVYEGFGYVPFEAAEAGVPCLYAATGALVELAGEKLATLVPWDADASAGAVARLLEPGEPRERHVSDLREAAARFSWATAVPRLRDVYAAAVASPHRASAPRVADDLERESYIVGLAASAEHDRARAEELQRANEHGKQIIDETEAVLERLRSEVGALAEVSDGGALSPAQRRGLLRVATRPALRRVLLAPFALLGRGESSSNRDT